MGVPPKPEDKMESQSFKHPVEKDIGLKNQEVWEIRGRITVFNWEGTSVLVRIFGMFEKPRDREIEILLFTV